MYGNNPIRKPVQGSGDSLDIQDIFFTLQGEGPYIGNPAIFIRLGGCNLACKFCDTEFENFQTFSLEDILNRIKELNNNNTKLIVITGGEPLRQPIELLCKTLIDQGYLVQIETNGTIFRNLSEQVKIICSPKNVNNKYYPIRGDLLSKITAFKFLISKNNPNYNFVPEIGQKFYNIPIYIQPMDEYNDEINNENMKFCLELSVKFGYNYSIQLHKILRIA